MVRPAEERERNGSRRAPRAWLALFAVTLAASLWWWSKPTAELPLSAARNGADRAAQPTPATATGDQQEARQQTLSTTDRAALADEPPDGDATDQQRPVLPTSIPEEFRFEVHGSIRSSRGQTIGGARVRLWAHGLQAMTTVAHDGEYRFAVAWRPHMETIHIDAWAEGYAADGVQVGFDPFTVGETGVRRDISLPAGHTIVGRAVGLSGPVAGAMVTCWQLDGARVGYFDHSDTDGHFVVPVLPKFSVDRVVVRHGVFGQGDAIVPRLHIDGCADVGDVVLATVSTVLGRVISPSGRGIANLPVMINVRDGSQFAEHPGASLALLRTDAGGAFAAHGLAAGPYQVKLRNAMIASCESVEGDWGASERTLVVEGARITVEFEWNGAPVATSLLDVEWVPPTPDWQGPSVGDPFDDRLVPFDTTWTVRAAFPDGRARGEQHIEVGRREAVHAVVRLQ